MKEEGSEGQENGVMGRVLSALCFRLGKVLTPTVTVVLDDRATILREADEADEEEEDEDEDEEEVEDCGDRVLVGLFLPPFLGLPLLWFEGESWPMIRSIVDFSVKALWINKPNFLNIRFTGEP